MSFAQLQSYLYAFVGELFMTQGVEATAQAYGILSDDWVEVMDQAVAIEMNNFFA